MGPLRGLVPERLDVYNTTPRACSGFAGRPRRRIGSTSPTNRLEFANYPEIQVTSLRIRYLGNLPLATIQNFDLP
jgi:hypothetical protein